MAYDHDQELKDANTLMGMSVKWIIIAVFILTAGGWALNALGLFGNTVVERKVMENSYQYSEARKSEIATFEAQLAEIDVQLDDPEIDAQTKKNLKAQKAAINVRLKAAKEKASKTALND